MNNLQILIAGIFILEIGIIFVFFSKERLQKATEEEIKKARKYKNPLDFISMKKYQFDKDIRNLEFLLGLMFLSIFGAKITNLLELLVNVFLSIIFVPGIILYWKLNRFQSKLVGSFYDVLNTFDKR